MSQSLDLRRFYSVIVFVAYALVAAGAAKACTIFLLTDGARALFFNNEDWSDPKTKIWFIPAGPGHYGAVYVGFDNGIGQGGMNTAGLAYDWVAGFDEKWAPTADMKPARGLSSQRMLETCATVDAAIDFYRKHREPMFSKCRMFVADRTGASAIIGAKNGQLYIERSNRNHGFGFGGRRLAKGLAKSPEPTVANGLALLRECQQGGSYATKYSNVFDLKSRQIVVAYAPEGKPVALDLADELRKGAHYYDIPALHSQLEEPLRPLKPVMKRFHIDSYPPIPDGEPDVTAHLTKIIRDVINGTARSEDYSAEQWASVAPLLKQAQKEWLELGEFAGLKLAERVEAGDRRTYRYFIEFKRLTSLQMFILDAQNKIVDWTVEALEPKN
jgi:hypothetical protein